MIKVRTFVAFMRRKEFRILAASFGLLLLFGTAGASDLDPTMAFSHIIPMTGVGLGLTYWGFRPLMS